MGRRKSLTATFVPPLDQATEGRDSTPPAYEFHPLADLFPLMEGAEFDELVEDIRENGQHQPIQLYEGKILDGRNRYRACQKLGISVSFYHSPDAGEEQLAREKGWPEKTHRAWDDKRARDYVLSMNLHRRHLTAEQRAEVILKLRNEGLSIRAIAEKTKTPKSTVARVVTKEPPVPNGTPETSTSGSEPINEVELRKSVMKGKVMGQDGKRYPARKPRQRRPSPRAVLRDAESESNIVRLAADEKAADDGLWAERHLENTKRMLADVPRALQIMGSEHILTIQIIEQMEEIVTSVRQGVA